MIEFKRYTLKNGLRVLLQKDNTTPFVFINTLYDVGSRDESPNKTGFAHLFEHLMFEGSVNIPDFDRPLQIVGGENNAFTNSDYTNYYTYVPTQNIETALWLESDRMLGLNFSQEKLNIQKDVVIEEYKQSYLNQPYGDAKLILKPMAYKIHPYRWSTIGATMDHIKDATLDDVKEFFYKYYAPNNAILSIVGNIDFDATIRLIEKWYSEIEMRNTPKRKLPKEPTQKDARTQTVTRQVPYDGIYKAYHMYNRVDTKFHATDLMSDVLSNGKSAQMHQNLVQKKKIFSSIDAYLHDSIDEGLFVVEGKLMNGIDMDKAEMAIQEELDLIKNEIVDDYTLSKVKNKIESTFVFSQISPLQMARTLASFELIGGAEMINSEVGKYLTVSASQIQDVAQEVFRKENCSTLYYLAEKK